MQKDKNCHLPASTDKDWRENILETVAYLIYGNDLRKVPPVISYAIDAAYVAGLDDRKKLTEEIINDLQTNPNLDGSTSSNIAHWIEQKQIQLRKKYL